MQILVNGVPTQIGSPLPPSIYALSILIPNQLIPKAHTPLVKQWLNTLVDKLDTHNGYISYNRALIKQDDLVKFSL